MPVDGDISLFVSGCTHHCKGCFNESIWDFAAGEPDPARMEALMGGNAARWLGAVDVSAGAVPTGPTGEPGSAKFLNLNDHLVIFLR